MLDGVPGDPLDIEGGEPQLPDVDLATMIMNHTSEKHFEKCDRCRDGGYNEEHEKRLVS